VTTVLSPSPKQKFFDNNGNPLVGGKLFVYVALTTTKATTYTSSTGLSTNTNPIILDYRGECNLWLQPNVAYKYVLAPANDTDPPTNPIFTVDQVVSSQLVTLYGGSDTGTPNAYALSFVANFTAYTDGIVIYWIPGNTNTTASTINVNGLGVVAIINQDGSALSAGQIAAGRVVEMIYKGTGFRLVNTEPTNVWGGTSAGVSGAYTLAATQFAAYRSGLLVYWIPNVTYTGGGCTINVNSLGSASIFNPDGTILVANQIVAGQVAQILYTGSYFILINGSVSSGTFTGTLTGMTGSVTATVQYYVSGNIVTLSFSNKTLDKTGTSNTTAMKLTGLPNVINPTSGTISTQFCGYVIDNSTARSAQAQIFNNEVNFFLGFDGSTLFTAAGTKGLNKNWTLLYQLN
jgi:hypothetical protein